MITICDAIAAAEYHGYKLKYKEMREAMDDLGIEPKTRMVTMGTSRAYEGGPVVPARHAHESYLTTQDIKNLGRYLKVWFSDRPHRPSAKKGKKGAKRSK